MTATPEKLQLMLYEGAIRFAGQARERLLDKRYDQSCDLLLRAQDIVLELMCALRHDLNADLCAKMKAVYSFIYRKLVDANMNRDAAAIDDAVKVLTIQRDIWLELVDKLARERAAETSAAGISA
jgi:flagellar secretion chaperone FliS